MASSPIRFPRRGFRGVALLACCVGLTAANSSGAPQRFDFGSEEVAAGAVGVAPTTGFSVERGHGLEPGATPVAVDRGGPDVLRRDFLTSEGPLLFSVVVPEGNYRVTVHHGDPAGVSDLTIKAETRRLMIERAVTSHGETQAVSFLVNVRNRRLPPPPANAPGGDRVRLNDREDGPRGLVPHWDDKLTLEFNGARPCVAAVEIERVDDAVTVFLAGDSTVTDQPGEPSASWGQMLTRFFGPGVAVANHAESGETLKSFLTGLRLDKLLSQIRAGDYLFIQFGHNDSKTAWPQTYVDAADTYRAYLKVYLAEARRRGAHPVLVTSVQRRQFGPDGRIRNSHGDYPAAVRAVAEEEGVSLIDLERMSVALYEALGPDRAPLAFAAGGRDATHHNNYGAYQLAQCVAQAIREQRLDLARHLAPDFKGYEPARPDPVDSFALPASPGRQTEAPRGN